MMGIEVVCTWGDGPDVLMSFKDNIFLLKENPQPGASTYGIVKNGTTDLTAEEAKWLAYRLLECVREVEELERICEEADNHASI